MASCCTCALAVPLACLLLIVVGAPLWVASSYTATSSTRSVLAAASMGSGLADKVLGVLGVARLVVLVLAVVTVAATLLLVLTRARRRAAGKQSASRCGPTSDGAASSLTWLLMLGAVVLIALYATWFATAMSADMLLNTATQYSSSAEKALSRAVGSANGLIDQLKAVQLVALDAAPLEVQESPWFRDFRAGVVNFNQTVSLAANTPTSAACQPGCIHLDFLAGLAGLESSCLCIQNTITAVQAALQSTKRATLLCLVGVLLVYLAASWLIIYFTASAVNARRDARERRRLAKSSSTGERLSSFGSGKLPRGADAAIDIRSAPSAPSAQAFKAAVPPSKAGVVPATAAAPQHRVAAAGHPHHRAQPAAYAQRQHAPAGRSSGGGADVAPRDNNRSQRLPYV